MSVESVFTKANINLVLSVIALFISTVLGINVLIEVQPDAPTDLNFSGDTDTGK